MIYYAFGLAVHSNVSLLIGRCKLPKYSLGSVHFRYTSTKTDNTIQIPHDEIIYKKVCIDDNGKEIDGVRAWFWKSHLCILYYKFWDTPEGYMRFIVSPDGTKVWCKETGKASVELLSAVLINRVLPYCSWLRKYTCLHCSAVTYKNHIFAFSGPSTSGKSTILFSLLARGFEFTTDDILPMQVNKEGTVYAWPGPMAIKLYPQVLYSAQEIVRPLNYKRELAEKVLYQPCSTPNIKAEKLLVIYLLNVEENRGNQVELYEISGCEKMDGILGNLYGPTAFFTEKLTQQAFVTAGKINRHTSVIRINYSKNGSDSLNRLIDVIHNDIEKYV